jgi:hypothetical protein
MDATSSPSKVENICITNYWNLADPLSLSGTSSMYFNIAFELGKSSLKLSFKKLVSF